jgi:hypothetical protein
MEIRPIRTDEDRKMARPERFERPTPRFVVRKYLFATLPKLAKWHDNVQVVLYLRALFAYCRTVARTHSRTPRFAKTV